MIGLFDRLARPLLRVLEPENAHALTLNALKFTPRRPVVDHPRLATRVFGLNFKNPVGIAPGFDKNADVPDALLALGFGFIEVGTVTSLPQEGNPRPRVFRLEADQGVINRLGFNSPGTEAVLAKLAARAGAGGIVGVNIGANRNSTDRAGDYIRMVEKFAPVASFITVNVSSPNTPGLRNLQQADALDDLLARIVARRDRVVPHAGPTPVLLKIAPDLSLNELDDVVGIARARHVDGMIVSNTTLSRPKSLQDQEVARQAGGLSGRPLFALATRMLAETFVRVEGAFPLIGVGGIDSGEAAIAKIRAGADLLQLYTGLIYHGLHLVTEIKSAIVNAITHEGVERLTDLVGVDAAAVTAEPWPAN